MSIVALHAAWHDRHAELQRLEEQERLLAGMKCFLEDQCRSIQEQIDELQARQDNIRSWG